MPADVGEPLGEPFPGLLGYFEPQVLGRQGRDARADSSQGLGILRRSKDPAQLAKLLVEGDLVWVVELHGGSFRDGPRIRFERSDDTTRRRSTGPEAASNPSPERVARPTSDPLE